MAIQAHTALLLVVLATFCCGSAHASEKLSELQAHFDKESNSIHKTKILMRLGDAQLAATADAINAKDYNSAGLSMEKYRDNVREALSALKKDHPDAERHPTGFKELQMHVHKALRELESTILSMPADLQPPMELVQKDLSGMNDELLDMLFPRRPDKLAKPPDAPPEKKESLP
jgi:hypothetical protein